MKIALLQINPTVGDLEGNARLIAAAAREASAKGADLAVTPELALVGYLPRDLLLSPGFVKESWDRLHELAGELAGQPPVLIGLPEPNPSEEGRPLFNTAALVREGRIEQRFRKSLLPTYDVFDEDRYFEPFHGAQILTVAGRRVGISICEDVERSGFLEAPPLPSRPDRRARQRRRGSDREPLRFAVHGGQHSRAKRCSGAWRANTACRSPT